MMIKQPELGKQIADSRKARGLTQEELVDLCNLSVRTLQRIEAGEVTPRAYTVRLLFDALGLDYNHLPASEKERAERPLIRQFYLLFIDLFNLKTNTMKKISILSAGLFALVIGITSLTGNLFAQSDSRVQKIIEKNNENFIHWFNNGEIGSLVELYREDACLVSRGCGKEFIRHYYTAESQRFRFTEIKVAHVSVSDTIAVEKGSWKAVMHSGETIGGEYLVEWKLTDKQWLVVSESSGLSFN